VAPVAISGATLLAVVLLATMPPRPTEIHLRSHGVTIAADGSPEPVLVEQVRRVNEDMSVRYVPVPAEDQYVAGTSVLQSADLESPAVRARIDAQRAWMAQSSVPGADTEFADMAERALLDLGVLTAPNGSVLASPVTAWKYVWPRDASFVVAALAVSGHPQDARDILGFLAQVAPDDGRWEARYLSDGSGEAPDNRRPQFDGAGWVPWAVWAFAAVTDDDAMVAETLDLMRDPVIASADAIVDSLGDDDLPSPSSDYWERPEDELSLGVVAPISLGLRAAIALAPDLGVDPSRWEEGAERLDAAITREFGAHGYPRYAPEGGRDAAVSFLAPPFAPASQDVRTALIATEAALRVPNGGHKPGEDWVKDIDVAWTPETSMMALAFAGFGDEDRARSLLRYLDTHRTDLGALPEKVDSAPKPASVAPLAWTCAMVLLTLAELDGDLPTVPR
jgi:glucoamylase